jgi:PAS domain S-box-containing protein
VLQRPIPTRLARYFIAVASTIVAALLRLTLDPLVGTGAPFTIFLLAVVVTASYGGFGPGLVATLLGFVLGDFLFVDGGMTFDTTGVIRMTSFLIIGIAISAVSEQWHRARRRDERRARELELQDKERLSLVAELSHSKQSLESLVAGAPMPIVVIDTDRTVKLWNEAAERVFGWKAEDVLWKTIPIVPTHLIPESQARTQAVARGERLELITTIRQHKDGRMVHVELSAAPLYGPRGSVESIVLILNDVTERATAQNALAQSEERLREANQRKDEFLATLAHELRNPLAPIRNSLQVMRLTGHDVFAVEKACALIERQVTQLVRLTDDLLDVSRISIGKMDLRKERIEVRSVLQSAIESSRPLIDARHHRLVAKLPPEALQFEGDMTRLAQVVSNLLQNAAKYTPNGGNIELSASRCGGEVVIAIRDNGIGIAPEMLPRVFELFMQVDRSEERTQGGTGIGLTLVKRIVDMHGGRVEARSEGLGTGSEFIVALPALETPSPPLPSTDGNGVEPRSSGVTRSRILVVDDSEDSASSLAMLLDLMGHRTQTAYDGMEAIRLAQEFRPDVIFLDLGMPGMSGYEVCRQLREQPEGTMMTVIALTGWGQEEDRQRTRQAGFDHHLVKPVEPHLLATLIERVAPKDSNPVADR